MKAHSSRLGFRIDRLEDLQGALPHIRAGIDRFATPLDAIMRHADLSADEARVHGAYCIAEAIISRGRQCHAGRKYVFEGKVEAYGIVDTLRGPQRREPRAL